MPPETFSNQRMDALGREVWYACMTKISEMLKGEQVTSYEKMDTLAHVADAAATGFEPSDEDEE